jgi:hypothetical protein
MKTFLAFVAGVVVCALMAAAFIVGPVRRGAYAEGYQAMGHEAWEHGAGNWEHGPKRFVWKTTINPHYDYADNQGAEIAGLSR